LNLKIFGFSFIHTVDNNVSKPEPIYLLALVVSPSILFVNEPKNIDTKVNAF